MTEAYCPTCDAVIPAGDTERDARYRLVHRAPDGSFSHDLVERPSHR